MSQTGKPAGPLTSLHDAAKWGDLEAITRLLEEGKAVDEAVSHMWLTLRVTLFDLDVPSVHFAFSVPCIRCVPVWQALVGYCCAQ